ncbi:MAG TPA: choice-of-anchor D domain-containing protein [Terriglobales bacterium]
MRRFIGIFALLLTAMLLSTSALAQQDIITTSIGGGPNDVPAVDADIYTPTGIAVDSSGNYYIAAYNSQRVFKVSTSGTLTVVAGSGFQGYYGDGGPATLAYLNGPQDVAVDSSGNVYISDYNNYVIRKVSSSGIITTIAGEAGQCNYNGDGKPATTFNLCHPVGLGLDSAGANLYIGDQGNCRVRKLTLGSDTIATYAGSSLGCGYSGDGGPATEAQLNQPTGVILDSAGDVFISDSNNARIREVTESNKKINTVAGDGTGGCSGDGGAATAAEVDNPLGLSVNSAGTIVTYADQYCQKIRQFTVGKTINTIAGTGSAGFSGDDGPATEAQLNYPQGIAATAKSGQFLVGDDNNFRVRQFTQGGNINTVAGNGSNSAPTIINKVAPSGVQFNAPLGVYEDTSKNIYVSDTDDQMVRELVNSTDLVDFFAGNGTYGYSGDGGPATEAELRYPAGSAKDSSGNLYIADLNNCLVRKVTSGGTISTFAGLVINGSPQCGYDGDGGPASSAKLGSVYGVAVDPNNNVYIVDRSNQVIREVSGGIISTIAGVGGKCAYSGDGGLAVDAFLCNPTAVAVDPAANVFIADEYNCRIREVTAATGIIDTVGGNGGCGFTGDGPATQEELNYPQGVAVDVNDNVFLSDTNNHIVRWISAGGLMTTIAGIPGSAGFGPDDVAATTSKLYYPAGVLEDGSGNYQIADQDNNRIREVSAFAALSVAPATLSFPLTAVGSTSNPQVVTLSALGPLTINNIQANGAFSEADDCPSSLPNGTTCTVYVYFTPTASGEAEGSITINDNGFFSAVSSVSLNGIGTAITLSGAPINFGSELVKTASATQTVTVTNTGTSSIKMGAITLNETTDFTIKSNTCPASGKTLAGGASCKIGVVFDPQSTGFKKGAVVINDSDPSSPQVAGVSGTGTSNVLLSPSSISFGNQAVHVAGSTTTVTLINNTGATLTLGNPALTVTAGFTINKSKTTCTNGLKIAASGNCAIGVQFDPTVVGYQTGTLSVADSDSTSPQTVSMNGTGISIGFTPTSVNFGTVTDGQCSSTDTVTIANTGPTTVTFTGADIVGPNSPDFREGNQTCGSSLAPGANCNIGVQFCPTTTKKESASYELFDNSGGSPQALPMAGTGQASGK